MLFVKKLDPCAAIPTCTRPGEDLGYDLYALDPVVLVNKRITKVRTGIAVEHQHAMEVQGIMGRYYAHVRDGLLILDRGSMASKNVTCVGGVIDVGYRGEIIVLLAYHGYEGSYQIQSSDKIAQLVPVPVLTHEGVMQIEAFTEEITSRGTKAFGSSGR